MSPDLTSLLSALNRCLSSSLKRYDVPPENPVIKSDMDAYPRPPPTEEERQLMPARHPVVTIMGHVDHGKTTLLDRLRKSNIVRWVRPRRVSKRLKGTLG